MTSTRLYRWTLLSATAAGIAWTALSLLSLATPEPARYLDWLMLVPLALSIGGITAVHLVQRDQIGRLGRIAYPLSAVSLVVLLAAQSLHLANLDDARNVVMIPGIAVWVLGFALFGIATARARVLPVWSGVLIALSEPLTVLAGIALSPISGLSNFGDYSGAIAHGIIWLSVGAVLRSLPETAGRHPALTAA